MKDSAEQLYVDALSGHGCRHPCRAARLYSHVQGSESDKGMTPAE